MSEILNEENDYRSSESGDDTVSLDFDRDDRLNRSRRDRSRSRSRSCLTTMAMRRLALTLQP